ncbi:very-long-chain (3R)-3-hydroxyacyl-CoA dehydratase-like [Mizuhopecten yessoensis]|uniref:Very-long-chain (3R)-3-hydroxyacyl-CoA dehydratase n=1 Tax=Mizuhopecten yessoensis TaxID=6573 RepID=A0A210QZC0_MIZYE|nr:very-long-chain (3R)-3-hydroxyacyl-CoA dehydratase-like [Mizuhopecten yessoensis]OWF54104.1 Very-long-chain (3R)-3-hydroxyacyl-[acyl-carrier protein] dehydratase [Mizuhopecten yessoensis]
MAEALSPFVYWGQKTDQVFLKVDLRDVENEEVKLTEDGLTFNAEGFGVSGQNYYGIDIEFYHPVDPEESKYRVMGRCIEFQIKKSGDGEIWPRLTYDKVKLPWLKIDFDKVAYDDTESEKEEEQNPEQARYLKDLENQLLANCDIEPFPDVKTCYLFVYNLVQYVGFTYIFAALTYHIFKDMNFAFTNTLEISGTQMLFVQTAAVLEIVHPLLGWVKSSPVPAFMQVMGRNFLLFIVLGQEPRLHDKSIVFILFMVWSAIEVVRYPFYMLSVLGKKNTFITWCRYTAWIPLYPLGFISEALIILMAIPYYEDSERFSVFLPNSYNFSFYFPWFLKLYLGIFIPAGYFLMNSMFQQRQKALKPLGTKRE